VVLPRGWTRQMGRRCRGSRLSRLRPVRPVERAGQRASGLRFADPRRTTGLELETSGSVPIAKGDGSQVRSGLADGGRRIRTRGPSAKGKAVGSHSGKHCRFGPEPVSGSAFRAAVSDWQRPEEPFAGAGPKDAMGRAARKWQLRRCIFSMECRDAPAERPEQIPRRPGPE
jgi:hypothetical protein